MPIQGLTQVRRLPRLGKSKWELRSKQNERRREIEIPQKTDHFVVPPEVEKDYGKEPKVLDILIPVEDEEKWAPLNITNSTPGLKDSSAKATAATLKGYSIPRPARERTKRPRKS